MSNSEELLGLNLLYLGKIDVSMNFLTES